MEQLNKVELRGVVGSVRTNKVGALTLYDFSVATNCTYNDKGGIPVIETTWHHVQVWSDKLVGGAVERGDKVHVLGRIKMQRYTDADGNDRTTYIIVSDKVKKLPDGALTMQSV